MSLSTVVAIFASNLNKYKIRKINKDKGGLAFSQSGQRVFNIVATDHYLSDYWFCYLRKPQIIGCKYVLGTE